MVVERPVAEVMTSPVFSVRPETPLQEAVTLLSNHHISGLPVVDAAGALVGELGEKDLMVRESGFDAGPYVMFLDAVIYLRLPCFAFDARQNVLVLPAFGSLTGGHPCPPHERLWLVAEGEVVPWTVARPSPPRPGRAPRRHG